MSEELHNYIRQAQAGGADHKTIKDKLLGAGWHPQMVHDALGQHGPGKRADAAVSLPKNQTNSQSPIAVVQTLSTHGMEYYFLIISLTVVAVSLGLLLHNIAAYLFSEGMLYAVDSAMMTGGSSALVVSLPIFIFFFLRLKKAELNNPSLLLDASRRRALQILMITTFVVGLISAVSYVIAFFSLSYGGSEDSPVGLLVADFIITTFIIGGIFANFWIESHRKGLQ